MEIRGNLSGNAFVNSKSCFYFGISPDNGINLLRSILARQPPFSAVYEQVSNLDIVFESLARRGNNNNPAPDVIGDDIAYPAYALGAGQRTAAKFAYL